MNIYRLSHRASCPNGNLVDVYKITIKSKAMLMVEDITSAIKSVPNPVFQEDLADHLRNTLGAEIIVLGTHYGIEIESRRK